ncbi:MAG TPA: biotin carboxylase N-terminal domain-containing protein [Syntrophales bacterium]|nr:biotin carboxylase N-terminal domain-containing protein [Syntrophales bacterium]HRT61288.1 biotin carboxylase N-terminal domain-containing protein [Syntrophales bacterium]
MTADRDRRKIRKILVANRGEVCLRILVAAKEMGIDVAMAYEEPDSDACFIRFADEAILIGSGPVKDYLDIEKMIWAARRTGADAIHPGYGFLSENPDFAEACEKAGVIFIGPPAVVLRNLINKATTRGLMLRADVPTIPGTQLLSSGERGLHEAVAFGRRYGYPVIVKATESGGGRGVRMIRDEGTLVKHLTRIRARPRQVWLKGAFLEKCIESVKTVSIPILADRYGNVIHLGSRDGSIQRRFQKILEIAPANVPEDTLESLYDAATRIAREVGYVSAGSIEFLVDPETGEYWFVAINRRLQVPHTITEELTAVDIVREQIRIAEGHRLDIRQEDIKLLGKAVQVRINAEDPLNNFRPEAGKKIDLYMPPGGPGIRLDGILYPGYSIPAEYDSLLVKMTVRGYDWEQVVNRLERALDSFLIVGPQTTIPLYRAICDEPDFRQEKIDTAYIQTHPQVFQYPDPGRRIARLESFLMEIYLEEVLPANWAEWL